MKAGAGRLDALDRGLHALFARHAERPRHERHRTYFRGADLGIAFEAYLARVYGLSWVLGVAALAGATALVALVPAAALAAAARIVSSALPASVTPLPTVPQSALAVGAGVGCGLLVKRAVVAGGGLYLRWVAAARRSAIDRTLPGAVRYLRALATGGDDHRAMLRKVAERDAYGETAAALQRVLNRAAVSGSLDSALREAARDTPSRGLFSPFLLKFREHANTGTDALRNYLRMESRMLSHRQDRERQRASDFLELLAELFIVLLVLPALTVIILTVLAVLAPGLSEPVELPLVDAAPTVRALLVYSSAAFALLVGACAAVMIEHIRPPDQAPPAYERPGGLDTVRTVAINPASALPPAALAGLLAAGALAALGTDPVVTLLGGYVAFGLPVGLVAVRRARLDDAKDREVKDFVHAVAGHMSLGQPFGEAVAVVAREVDLGALQGDVDDLAFTLSLSGTPDDGAVRREALDRFVDGVGTPLAAQTVGLVTGALDVGGETEAVFDTLQTEVGRLYHAKKKLRNTLLVYVAVGWTTALLVVGISVAVNAYVLDGFAQLSTVSSSSGGVAIAADAIDPARDRYRFYVVTQATMLACGWFAGAASRGVYEALLHSAALVAVCHLVFAGTGMI